MNESQPGVDWSRWYISEQDDEGETPEQGETIRLLLKVLKHLARERSWKNRYIGGDNFFQWVQNEPLVQVSPDIYIVEHKPVGPLPPTWQTWREGIPPPRFAVEIVLGVHRKDHDDYPERYASLGCSELVIFNPRENRGRPKRPALAVYRRDPDGAFVRAYSGPGPAHSRELGVWLVVVPSDGERRIRLSRDAEGQQLVPTDEEIHEGGSVRNGELVARIAHLKAELAHKNGKSD